MILIARKTAEPKAYTFDLRRLTGRKPSPRDAQALLRKEVNVSSEYLTPTFDRASLCAISAHKFRFIIRGAARPGSNPAGTSAHSRT